MPTEKAMLSLYQQSKSNFMTVTVIAFHSICRATMNIISLLHFPQQIDHRLLIDLRGDLSPV